MCPICGSKAYLGFNNVECSKDGCPNYKKSEGPTSSDGSSAKKYWVIVNRTAYSSLEIEVEAADETEAEQKALDRAGDLVFSEKDADYEVDCVRGACIPPKTPMP